jgi:hypothetical protein
VGGYAAHAVIVIGFALFLRDLAANDPRVDGAAVHPMSHPADFP